MACSLDESVLRHAFPYIIRMKIVRAGGCNSHNGKSPTKRRELPLSGGAKQKYNPWDDP